MFYINGNELLFDIILNGSIAIGIVMFTLLIVHYSYLNNYIRLFVSWFPNFLSLVRIPMGLITIWFIEIGNFSMAFVCFTIGAVTDFSDGYVARGCNLISENGKSLDPLGDKFLYGSLVIYFGLFGYLEWYLAVIFIGIDSLSQISRYFLKREKQETAARWYGKAKTVMVITFVLWMIFILKYVEISSNFYLFNQLFFGSCCIFALLSLVVKWPQAWKINLFRAYPF